jgi:TRAP-type C4-dicarboxylate transport system substrate-binding protein
MKEKRGFRMASVYIILILLVTTLSACASKEEPAKTAAPTAQAPAKVITIRMATWHPAKIPAVNAGFWTVREFARRSMGRVKVEEFFSGTLAGGKEILQACGKGVVDACLWVPPYNPGMGPLAEIGYVPAVVGSTWSGIMAFNRCYAEFPEIEKEFTSNNVVYLGGTGNPRCNIISTKPIRSLDDLKGLKINAGGSQQVLLSKFGVPAISIVSTEVYEALKRGTVDGNVNNPEWARVYNFHEASKYWYDIPVGGFIFFSIMNKDFFNKLPADLQKLLLSLRDPQAEANYMIYDVASDQRARGIMYKTLEVIKPPQADIDQFLKIAKETVWTDWIKEIEKRGLPGQKLFDRWLYWNDYYSKQEHPTYIGSLADRAR